MLARERALLQENEDLRRKTSALKANWQTCDDELRRVQVRVPSLEQAVRDLEHENRDLRRSFDDPYHRQHQHHHQHHGGKDRERDREEAMRKLRNKNTKLRNDNETLMARVGSLQRDIREGVGDRARRLMEEVSAWQRRHDRLGAKLEYVAARNRTLESHNEYLVRQETKYRNEVTRLDAILRHHGLSAVR